MRHEKLVLLIIFWFLFFLGLNGITSGINSSEPSHCTGVIIGKKLTADGSILIGQNADEQSSHWLEVIPRKKHTSGEYIDAAGATQISTRCIHRHGIATTRIVVLPGPRGSGAWFPPRSLRSPR